MYVCVCMPLTSMNIYVYLHWLSTISLPQYSPQIHSPLFSTCLVFWETKLCKLHQWVSSLSGFLQVSGNGKNTSRRSEGSKRERSGYLFFWLSLWGHYGWLLPQLKITIFIMQSIFLSTFQLLLSALVLSVVMASCYDHLLRYSTNPVVSLYPAHIL